MLNLPSSHGRFRHRYYTRRFQLQSCHLLNCQLTGSRTFVSFLTEPTVLFAMMNNLVSSLVCINLPNIHISCKLTFTSKGDLGESVSRNHNVKCTFVSVCNQCMCNVLCLCCAFYFCVCKIPHFLPITNKSTA